MLTALYVSSTLNVFLALLSALSASVAFSAIALLRATDEKLYLRQMPRWVQRLMQD